VKAVTADETSDRLRKRVSTPTGPARSVGIIIATRATVTRTLISPLELERSSLSYPTEGQCETQQKVTDADTIGVHGRQAKFRWKRDYILNFFEARVIIMASMHDLEQFVANHGQFLVGLGLLSH
jgi:hypothetical protein